MTTRILYTQFSIAFPDNPAHDHGVYDDVNVTVPGMGEFTFTFRRFNQGGDSRSHMRVECFGDGLGALLTSEMQVVLHTWHDLEQVHEDSLGDGVVPEMLLDWLEAVGAEPSEYQLRGLSRLPADHGARVRTQRTVTTDAVQRAEEANARG